MNTQTYIPLGCYSVINNGMFRHATAINGLALAVLQCLQQQAPGSWAALWLAEGNKVVKCGSPKMMSTSRPRRIVYVTYVFSGRRPAILCNSELPKRSVASWTPPEDFPRLLWRPDFAADRFILFSGSQARKIVIRYRWHTSAECRMPFSCATKWGYTNNSCVVCREKSNWFAKQHPSTPRAQNPHSQPE